MQIWKCNICGEKYLMYDLDCPPSKEDSKCGKDGCKGKLEFDTVNPEGYSFKIGED